MLINLSKSHDTNDEPEYSEDWILKIPQCLFSLEKVSLSEINESELLDYEKLVALNLILSSAKC